MKNLKKFILAFLTLLMLLTVSNAVCANPSTWVESFSGHVVVDTYQPHSLLYIKKFKVLLTEDMRTNISQYLGADKTNFKDPKHLFLVITEDSGVYPESRSKEMLLRPQTAFSNQVPSLWKVYPTTNVGFMPTRTYTGGDKYFDRIPTPHTAATPHTDFDIGAFVNIDARVFGLNQVADLVRYDRAYVNYHTMLYTPCDANGHPLPNLTEWTYGISPDNCHLGFQSDNAPRAVLSLCDYNGGPVGTLNGRTATDLTPVSKMLTLNILLPRNTEDYITNVVIPKFPSTMTMDNLWKNVFLDLFRQHFISAEVMCHLLGFSVAELGAKPLAITPALPRGAARVIAPQNTLQPVSTPRRRSSSTPAGSMPKFVTTPTWQDVLLPIHRVYDGKVHHYTSNYDEVQCLLDLGWTYEQPAFESFPDYQEGRFEIFRLYNPNDPFGNHLLTINEYERDQLIALGWILEGSNGFVVIENRMFRIYNPGTGEHFYTRSYEEVQKALELGWQLDGTVW